MNQSSTLYVGMDVHKASIAVAYGAQDHGAELIDLGTIGPRHGDIDQLVRKMPSKANRLVFGYEAGPCGYWLSRSLMRKGDDCWVVAPFLIPQKAGDRGKTDRRDAGPLARLARSGDLTPVQVPTVEDEALRALTRAREETLSALKAAKFRLQAFWLRHYLRQTGRATWGPAHLRWLSAVGCATPAPPLVFQDYVWVVNEHPERLQRRAQARHEPVNAWRLYPVVEALQAWRGGPCPVAITTVAALGDLTRFATPRALMKCLGLLPSEYSTGERRRQGSLTTAGHTHARRALVEGAWAYRDPATVSRHLPLRLEQQPKILQDMSWKAPVRLGKRYRRLIARGTHANQVVVAMAREFVGCMGAMAKQVPVTVSGQKIEPD